MIIDGDMDGFWKKHENRVPQGFFSEEFKQLLNFMFRSQPNLRAVFTDVCCHNWLCDEAIAQHGVIRAHFQETHDEYGDGHIVAADGREEHTI